MVWRGPQKDVAAQQEEERSRLRQRGHVPAAGDGHLTAAGAVTCHAPSKDQGPCPGLGGLPWLLGVGWWLGFGFEPLVLVEGE